MSTTPYPGRHRYPQSPLLSLEPKQNRRSLPAVALVSAGLMAVGVTTGAGQLSSANSPESSVGSAAVAGSTDLLALDSSSTTVGTAPTSAAAATAATLASAGLSAAQEAAVQRDVAEAAAVVEARAAVTRRAQAAAAAHAAQVAKAAKVAAAAKAAKAKSSGSTVPASGSPRDIGRALAAARGWGDAQFQCLNKLWTKESNWSVSADNPSSSAYGIPQALPGSKMASAGPNWRTNAATQITWGLNYIASRYGTPCAAWGHSVSHNWY